MKRVFVLLFFWYFIVQVHDPVGRFYVRRAYGPFEELSACETKQIQLSRRLEVNYRNHKLRDVLWYTHTTGKCRTHGDIISEDVNAIELFMYAN